MSTPISVVMPAYQLGSSIHHNILEVASVLEALPGSEIIVVDDGSTDDTFAQATKAAGEAAAVRVLRHDTNLGKGGALRTGGLAAERPVVVLLDGDLDLPPDQIPDLVETLSERDLDVLVGTKRYGMSGGRYPWKRRLLSGVFRLVIRILFRLQVSETQTGLKLFRRDVLQAVLPDLTVTRYAFDLELLVRADRYGARIGEVPVALRVGASSAPLSMSTLWEMGRDTFKIFWWSLRSRDASRE
ncbi:MAG TPA: glycosyltransferase family 2 protein [Actinobacteria bacterium]|nr:glycosyltransferase family 2 protein [Actinomycetota bacterium]